MELIEAFLNLTRDVARTAILSRCMLHRTLRLSLLHGRVLADDAAALDYVQAFRCVLNITH